jgi:uncharacterized protein (TIGR03083 family)
MDVWSSAPLELGGSLGRERRDLLELLGSLSGDEWLTPTPALGWCVRDVALHLLDDDLGWLSRSRDGDLTGVIPTHVDHGQFVRALDDKNQRWIDAANGLSQRVVGDLLAWSGEEVAAYHENLVLNEPTDVRWAGGEVPGWLGIGRDFTERWVHQKQIRQAVGRPGDHDRYLPTVLSIFVWAFPHQYHPVAEVGTTVDLNLGTSARWHLVRNEANWELKNGPAASPAAAIVTEMRAAWRQLTGASVRKGKVTTSGPAPLALPLLDVRGIIV